MATPKARGEGKQARWPDIACPDGSAVTARDLLHAVVFLAARDGAPDLGGIIRLVLRCATHGYATHGYETNLSPLEHCRLVLLAKMHADARDWHRVAEDLKH